MKIAVVGCTGKLGSIIMKKLLDREDMGSMLCRSSDIRQ